MNKISNDIYRIFFNNSDDYLMIIGPDGNCIEANPAVYSSLNYAKNELATLNISDILLSPDFSFPPDKKIKESAPYNGELVTKDRNHISGLFRLIDCGKGNSLIIFRNYATEQQDIAGEKETFGKLLRNDEHINTIIDFLPDPTFIIDRENKILAWNNAIEQLTGINRKEMIGKGDYQYSIPFYGIRKPGLVDLLNGDSPETETNYDSIIKKANMVVAQRFLPRLNNGAGGYYLIVASSLIDRDGNKVGAIESIKEITDWKKTEDALARSEERYRVVSETTGQLIYDWDIATGDVRWTGKIEEMTGYSPGIMNSFTINGWVENIHPEDREQARMMLKKALKERTNFHAQYRFHRQDGSFFYVEDNGIFQYGSNDRAVRMLGSLQSIHERKKAEESLRINEARLKRGEIVAGFGTWEFDLVTRQVYSSEGARRIYGLPDRQWTIPEIQSHALPEYRPMLDDAMEKLIKGLAPYDVVFKMKRPADNKIRDIRSIAEYDSERHVIFGIIHDITETNEYQEKIKSSLHEKETLLRELYHRTKNNMQVIASLLHINSLLSSSNEVKQIVKDTIQRINTIGLVHQKLYQSQNLSSIDLKEYVAELVSLLVESLNNTKKNISVTLDLQVFPVLIDIAIPCGLMLNELVTNSLKHAFNNKDEGNIYITLSRSSQGMITLHYSDNGSGFPDGFDVKADASLGLMTIQNIGEHQLGGSVSFQSVNGLTCHIEFNENVYSQRV